MSSDEKNYDEVLIKKGFLEKKGAGTLGVGKGWRRRYFCLRENGLDYFDDNTLETQKGTINLKSIIGISYDKTEINMQDQNGRLWQLKAPDEIQAQNWCQNIKCQIFGRVIHQGTMTKRGGKYRNWKVRFFVLRDTKILDYYEDDKQEKLMGKIDLLQIRLISPGTKQVYGKEHTLQVITKDRNWVFSCNDEEDLETWIGHLERSVPGAKRLITTKEGELMISGEVRATKWKQRYFALCRGWLFYFETDVQCAKFKGMVFFMEEMFNDAFKLYVKGSVDLRGATIKRITRDKLEHPHGLDITATKGTYRLSAHTVEERDSWFETIAPICRVVDDNYIERLIMMQEESKEEEHARKSLVKVVENKEPVDD